MYILYQRIDSEGSPFTRDTRVELFITTIDNLKLTYLGSKEYPDTFNAERYKLALIEDVKHGQSIDLGIHDMLEGRFERMFEDAANGVKAFNYNKRYGMRNTYRLIPERLMIRW